MTTASAQKLLNASSSRRVGGVKLPRQIDRLSSALLLQARPSWMPKPKRHTGSRAKGVAYEKKVIKHLNRKWPNCLQYHKWIEYSDANGGGYCEPEAYIELKDRVILFECKLTGGIAGRMQMEGLYRPLLEAIFEKPVYCLLVCKWTTPDTPGPFFNTVEDFLRSGERFGTWHWLPTP